MPNPSPTPTTPLSAREFLALGLSGIAYVRRQLIDGEMHFTIHTAYGAEVAEAETLDEALETVRANDLEPVWLH